MKKIIIAIGLALLVFAAIRLWPRKALQWHEENGFRWAELPVPKYGKTGFEQLPAAKTGIAFVNSLTEEQITGNSHLLNGSGVAVGDVDGDGLVDVYFCRLDGSNGLYKNLGNWKFKDITNEAGVACPGQFSTGCALADIDGDGDLDLLVAALGGPNACFLNDAAGKFTDITKESGIVSNTGATSMALADIDGDGDLDLYVANYKKQTVQDLYPPQQRSFERTVKKVDDSYVVVPEFQEHYTVEVIRGQILKRYEVAEADRLYLNDGSGRFSPVPFTAENFLDAEGKPMPEPKDWGLTVRFQDMDDDGDPDIYVCNDFESPDHIWINDGAGRFRAMPKLAIRNTSAATMGIDFSDVDRDGDLDFFLVDMLSREHQRRKAQMGPMAPTPVFIGEIDNRPQYMRNTLFLNRGDQTYAEIAQFSGVQASEWSWSPMFLDVDLDGYEDILIVTGHFYDAMDADTQARLQFDPMLTGLDHRRRVFIYPKLKTPNIAFRNRGDLTFEEVGQAWGFASTDISHGMALGDFDNDGDLDIVTNRFDTTAGVYRNETVNPRLAVRLKGLPPNTQGIGAKIRVLDGPAPQSKEVISAGAYLSSSEPLYVFAGGRNEAELTIEVKWRNGKQSLITGVKPNRIYEIDESAAQPSNHTANHAAPAATPYFEDASALIRHEHHEEPFNDFARQELLPYRLSQLGPGVAWHDLDGDGDDDLIIAGGKGGQLACFRNDGKGGFQCFADPLLDQTTQHDQTAVLGWTHEDGAASLLVGHSNFEEPKPIEAFVRRYDFKNGAVKAAGKLTGDLSSTGPMAMADYDGDGDLDLFVGGRTIPTGYPAPASSQLYRNENGAFALDQQNSAPLKDIGMVSGAVFSDFDGDGDADLILAVEWGPITILRNTNGVFANVTAELGLEEYRGWWNGVTTGDLNEDGRLDLVATNWGLNTKYHADAEQPLRIYYDDFDRNGTLDVVEAHFDANIQTLVPERGFSCMSNAMPYIRFRAPTYKKFGGFGLQEIIGPGLNQAREVQANTLAHTIFFNYGNRFEAVAMPVEAQLAPAFHVGVADFDGDGHDDVFISQNFFAYQIETSRSDAGRGLWLKGDGAGKLHPVPGQESGIKVYGEQRGAALGDYDRDGRVDLVVTQNGAATKLYHNVGAKPGLCIRLAGPKANPSGTGAAIRLVYSNGYGPVREVHAGSGYWSQNAMTQIMGCRETPKGVWVRWPGGGVTTVEIPDQTGEVMIGSDGMVKTEEGK
ncbi:FG-GAP-like repeat-containing protein [candidate division KSB1 bacterium]|nr:FG-GAP-like repeat-containing protein [candidate division KSB1 bacterium]